MSDTELIDWLTKRLDDGCTDTTIFRGRDGWSITFRNAGIPSECGGTERYETTTARGLRGALITAKAATEARLRGIG